MRMKRVATKGGRKPPMQAERRMQTNLFAWAGMAAGADFRLRLLFAVPNGGKRDVVTASILKREGVKAGVPDIFLPVPMAGWHGLWLELKAGKSARTSEKQDWWIAVLRGQGYAVFVVRDDWQDGQRIIEDYLAGKIHGADIGRYEAKTVNFLKPTTAERR